MSLRVGIEKMRPEDCLWHHEAWRDYKIYPECEGRIEKSVARITFGIRRLAKTIRIRHECEGRIEKFVPRITV